VSAHLPEETGVAQRRLVGTQRSRAIVSAALGLFARRGFNGTTTREVARAAGVSEALLFKHFPRKDSLYRAILESKIRDAERALPLDDSLLALGDEAFLLRIATDVMRRVDADDAFCRLMLRSAMEGHDLARQFRKARAGRLLKMIEMKIRTRYARRAGIHRPDPALAARIFNGMILSSMLQRCIFREPVVTRTSIDRLARTLVRIFLQGIDPGKTRS
jgi:TetR/AcrR family transcriptional regulator